MLAAILHAALHLMQPCRAALDTRHSESWLDGIGQRIALLQGQRSSWKRRYLFHSNGLGALLQTVKSRSYMRIDGNHVKREVSEYVPKPAMPLGYAPST